MRKRIKTVFGFIALCAFFTQSCDNWLDVKPSDRITEQQVFSTTTGFHAAINGVYTQMLSDNLYGKALSCEFIEIMAQRYSVQSSNSQFTEVAGYKYTAQYPKLRLQAIWEEAYKLILDCNKILENAENSEVLEDPDYSLITGEALALRAFLHFDMLRLFGPVMLVNKQGLSIPYVEARSVSAFELMPADSLIDHKIIRDLDRAEALLLKSDPILTEGPMAFDDTDNTYKARVLRMNYYAVIALKARVYLYAGNKPQAAKYAKMIIEDPKRETYFPFITHEKIKGDSKNPDRVFSTEVIFSLYNPDRSQIYTNYFDTESAGDNLLRARPTVVEKLFQGEENDYRYSPLWKNSTIPGDNSRVNAKFRKLDNTTLFYNNMMPLIRLGELYLIAAESEAEPQAYDYLNKLRENRGQTQIVSSQLAANLKKEYIREFLCEGQLFFYYKRVNEMFIESGTTGAGLMMTRGNYLIPLPESELKYRN